MRPDTVSVILRGASFIALFQAAGMAIFLAMFGRRLELSSAQLKRITRLSALAAAAFLIGQYLMEAARMADAMAGIVDPSLQMMAMHSMSSAVLGVRLVGLLVIAFAAGRQRDIGATLGVVGAVLIGGSFMLIGHIAAHPLRWALAPVLTVHVMIVAFWFGALIPLYVACRREPPAIAGQVTAAFSKVAMWLVPGIVVAGVAMACVLIPNLGVFRTGYGLSLLAKFLAFVVLMGIASLNKSRLGPAIYTGEKCALRSFRRSLGFEYVLIAAVLCITAVMTTFYSPGENDSSMPTTFQPAPAFNVSGAITGNPAAFQAATPPRMCAA